ncbi:hypothetical protein SANTM175S_01512 [Streptomyces antimycoticus]
MPETWTATVASGRSIEKFATFETTSTVSSPCRKDVEELLPLGVGRLALDDRCAQVLAQLVELVDVLADDEGLLPGLCRTSASVTFRLVSVVAQKRYFSSVSAVAYVSRSASVRLTRTSTQSAGAM